MKKMYFLGMMCLASGAFFAQTFSDNFDSYTAGGKLAAQSGGEWTTWGNSPGSNEDADVTNAMANSLANSIYFASTAQGGGPTDLVRNFGVLNTGQFSLEWNMYIPTGKSAYFNLQKTATIGQTWAFSGNFNDDGTVDFDGASADQLVVNYPQGAWFNFRLDVNFNLNRWEVYFNDTYMGMFQNGHNQVASIDIFPTDQNAPYDSEFYIDDFEYTVTPYTLPSLNGGVTTVGFQGANLVGAMVKPRITVRNLGVDAINSISLEVNYNGTTINQDFTGLNLASLAETTLDFTQALGLIGGSNDMTARITSVNGVTPDGDVADDQNSISINPIQPAYGKIVVGEEGTGTWCQFCPRGAVYMDKYSEEYGMRWAGIAVHNSDPMEVTVYDTGLGGLIGGYPSSLVDRVADIDPSDMNVDFEKRIILDPVAVFENAALFDTATRVLDINVRTNFLQAGDDSYKLICVLTEDSVTGTDAGYAQVNAYSGGGLGEMGGYENLPNPVPASMMVYNHVARAIAPSFEGATGVYPASIIPGQQVKYDFSFTLPADWDVEKMHIVTMLVNADGTINNAGYGTINQALLVGLNENTQEHRLQVYPNPAKDKLFILSLGDPIKNLKVLGADGRIVFEGILNQANGILPVDQLSSGVYTILFETTKGGYGSHKFIKE